MPYDDNGLTSILMIDERVCSVDASPIGEPRCDELALSRSRNTLYLGSSARYVCSMACCACKSILYFEKKAQNSFDQMNLIDSFLLLYCVTMAMSIEVYTFLPLWDTNEIRVW